MEDLARKIGTVRSWLWFIVVPALIALTFVIVVARQQIKGEDESLRAELKEVVHQNDLRIADLYLALGIRDVRIKNLEAQVAAMKASTELNNAPTSLRAPGILSSSGAALQPLVNPSALSLSELSSILGASGGIFPPSVVDLSVLSLGALTDSTLSERVRKLEIQVERLFEASGLDLNAEALSVEIEYWETVADDYPVDEESPYDCAVAGSCDSPSSNWESPLERERLREAVGLEWQGGGSE